MANWTQQIHITQRTRGHIGYSQRTSYTYLRGGIDRRHYFAYSGWSFGNVGVGVEAEHLRSGLLLTEGVGGAEAESLEEVEL